MKILICEWTAYMQTDLEECLHQYGIETVEYGYRINNFEEDAYFQRRFRRILVDEKDRIDAVMSMNYMAPLAVLCAEIGKPYIAWVYDCPFGMKHPERTLELPTNYVFFFDRAMTEDFAQRGMTTVYHLPLAVDAGRIDELLTDTDMGELYRTDISFVGNLYGNRYDEFRRCLPAYEDGYLAGLIRAQSRLYGEYVLKKSIREKVTPEWQKYFGGEMMEQELFLQGVEHTLAKEVTRQERITILKLLSRRYPTTLYSPSTDSTLPDVVYGGVVSAYQEAPFVYHNSRINLNITLKDITSGIPLRVFEILGSGGFLLTNWQIEIAENFIDGEEVVMYDSTEDAIRKAIYYLSHEEERARIAAAGRRAIERFSFPNQVGQILKTVFPETVWQERWTCHNA